MQVCFQRHREPGKVIASKTKRMGRRRWDPCGRMQALLVHPFANQMYPILPGRLPRILQEMASQVVILLVYGFLKLVPALKSGISRLFGFFILLLNHEVGIALTSLFSLSFCFPHSYLYHFNSSFAKSPPP